MEEEKELDGWGEELFTSSQHISLPVFDEEESELIADSHFNQIDINNDESDQKQEEEQTIEVSKPQEVVKKLISLADYIDFSSNNSSSKVLYDSLPPHPSVTSTQIDEITTRKYTPQTVDTAVIEKSDDLYSNILPKLMNTDDYDDKLNTLLTENNSLKTKLNDHNSDLRKSQESLNNKEKEYNNKITQLLSEIDRLNSILATKQQEYDISIKGSELYQQQLYDYQIIYEENNNKNEILIQSLRNQLLLSSQKLSRNLAENKANLTDLNLKIITYKNDIHILTIENMKSNNKIKELTQENNYLKQYILSLSTHNNNSIDTNTDIDHTTTANNNNNSNNNTRISTPATAPSSSSLSSYLANNHTNSSYSKNTQANNYTDTYEVPESTSSSMRPSATQQAPAGSIQYSNSNGTDIPTGSKGRRGARNPFLNASDSITTLLSHPEPTEATAYTNNNNSNKNNNIDVNSSSNTSVPTANSYYRSNFDAGSVAPQPPPSSSSSFQHSRESISRDSIQPSLRSSSDGAFDPRLYASNDNGPRHDINYDNNNNNNTRRGQQQSQPPQYLHQSIQHEYESNQRNLRPPPPFPPLPSQPDHTRASYDSNNNNNNNRFQALPPPLPVSTQPHPSTYQRSCVPYGTGQSQQQMTMQYDRLERALTGLMAEKSGLVEESNRLVYTVYTVVYYSVFLV